MIDLFVFFLEKNIKSSYFSSEQKDNGWIIKKIIH